MAERRQEGLYQAIAQVDVKHDAAHKRLREDFRVLEERMGEAIQLLRDRSETNAKGIDKLVAMPVDATKLMLRAPVVVTVLVFALGMAAAVWSIRSSMERLSDKVEATAKLQDVQNSGLKSAVDAVSRRQELLQYEFQSFKEQTLMGAIKNGNGNSNGRK